MTEFPDLLAKLLRADGPSGYELPAATVWREAASFATVSTDKIGSSIARAGTEAPVLAVVGHIDEIGLVVTHIDEKGLLWLAPIGFWDPKVLVNQRVRVHGAGGIVPGVVGRRLAASLVEQEETKKPVELGELHVDIGCTSAAEAGELVEIGDPIVVVGEPLELAGGRLASKAMDNRLGAYMALESLRRCLERGGPPGSFAAVASVQEEIGLLGARPSVYELRPDVAVAVDVLYETDAPGTEAKATGPHPFGSGPIIGRGPTISPKVSRLLIETARELGIPHTVAGYGFTEIGISSANDADALQLSRAGIPTGAVSVPLRYMHSPVEVVDSRDVEGAIELLTAFALRLDAGVDLSR